MIFTSKTKVILSIFLTSQDIKKHITMQDISLNIGCDIFFFFFFFFLKLHTACATTAGLYVQSFKNYRKKLNKFCLLFTYLFIIFGFTSLSEKHGYRLEGRNRGSSPLRALYEADDDYAISHV